MAEPEHYDLPPKSRINEILDALANVKYDENSPEQHHEVMRRRLLVYLSIIFTSIIVIALIQRYIEFGFHTLTWSMALVGAITFSPIITLKIFPDIDIPAKVLCLGGLASLALLTYMTEGIASPTMAWVAAVPLFATFIVGSRFGILVGILGSIIILAFFFVTYFDFPLPPIPDDKFILGGRLISLAGLTLSIALLGLQYEKERKRSLRASLRLQADFQVLIEASPEGIAVLSHDKIVYSNPGLSEILKVPNAELQGHRLDEFAHTKSKDSLARAIAQPTTGADQTNFDFVRRDNNIVKIEIDEVSEIEFNGARCTLVMLRDLSERSRLEAQLRVTDRLSSVCSLAAGMAHEINNPIAFIKGNLEYISEILVEKGLDKELEDVQAAVFESIEGVLRVATIVQDMQALARIQPKESAAIDLSSTVHSAIKLTNHETKRRSVLEIDIADNLIVVADAANLHQILINLLINAAEAMPEENQNENILRVYCAKLDKRTTVIEIHDSGPGIPENELAQVFDPFYTTKEIGQGTGLGLSSCLQLVTAMKGTLELENHRDGGLVARITLPSSN